MIALWFDRPPELRGPAPQWIEWSYYFAPKPIPLRILVTLALGAGLVGMFAAASRSGAAPPGARHASSAAFLSLAALLGFAWWISLLGLKPSGAVQHLVADTLSPTRTSYLNVAMRPEAERPLDFMRQHHELILNYRSESLHASTHPPGPVLFYRAVYGLVRTVPGVAEIGARAIRARAGDLWPDTPAMPPNTRPGVPPAPTSDAALASALLSGSLVLALGIATIFPLFMLARGLGVSEGGARLIALTWLLMPGPALMAPEFDQALAFPITFLACALLWAVGAPDPRRAALRGGAAGALAAVCMELSYGSGPFLAVLALGAAAWAWRSPIDGKPHRDRRLDFAALGALAAFLLVFAGLFALGRRPVASFIAGMINHRIWIGHRTYTIWLLFNPIEFLVFFGPPTVLAGAIAHAGGPLPQTPGGRALRRFKNGCLVGLAALVASGGSPGEVGRIWIPLMPLFAVIILGKAEAEGPENPEASPRLAWTWMAGALAALCVVMRLRWDLP